ncbi:MAG: hypothetical protein OSB45_04130 [Pseudomonadales bacterium]|nr:hypothetical protein [Pseudomonadales bacterium]
MELKNFASLLDNIAKNAPLAEQLRRLPDPLVTELKMSGAFRALIPKKFSGLELPFEQYLDIIKSLAEQDASTAWCVNQAAVIATTSLWLPDQIISEIWGDPLASVANGPPYDCTISYDNNGYKLTGHWGFSSGCQHATWMTGPARFSEGGWRSAFFRPDQAQFDDTWQVAGLKATGSFEFRVKDLLVPATQVVNFDEDASVKTDITSLPTALMFAISFAAVGLGVAKGALSDVIKITQGKKPQWAALRLHEDPDVQRFLGKATARWRSADAYLRQTTAEVLDSVRCNLDISHSERSQLRMAGTHVIQECAEVVDLAYKVSGSTGIYQDEVLQRRFQDMHVITQHVQGRESYFGLLGRYAITGHYETGPMT